MAGLKEESLASREKEVMWSANISSPPDNNSMNPAEIYNDPNISNSQPFVLPEDSENEEHQAPNMFSLDQFESDGGHAKGEEEDYDDYEDGGFEHP